MQYYPVYLDIHHKNCLVVGGGSVGTRKVKTLLDCGASVTVVSPTVSESLAILAEAQAVQVKKRAYRSTDVSDMFLVIGATNDEELNQQVSRDAERRNTLCNIADRPSVCNFILPSIVRRGDLVIAISTSGNSPAFAKKLRRDMEKQYGEEYAVFLKLMGAIRKRLLQEAHEPEAHKPIFNRIIQSDLIQRIREGDEDAANAILYEILGRGYRFRDLVFEEQHPVKEDAPPAEQL
ncbi:MAG: bifunctional precorrin-2 dehydrogenase/sirohydrochlorin ferrochelatase [Deltaproteobacteria bacterium]